LVGLTWDLAQDEINGDLCKPYGVGNIMRMPGRVHITWENDDTLRIDTDAGEQTRLLHFGGPPPPAGERTWQGQSVASWERSVVAPPDGQDGRGVSWSSLKVVTSHFRAGYLRLNGVPYSEDASITEYLDRHTEPDGSEWFTVTTIIDDPTYLTQRFITSSSFKREPDGAKWTPTPCIIDPPLT